eukprot:2749788-Pyramimonas_sp.AAC.1
MTFYGARVVGGFEDGVANLGQNPEAHAHCDRGETGKGTLPTSMKSSSVTWSFKHKRWLTPMEMLSSQTMPFYSGMNPYNVILNWHKDREYHGYPPRKRNVIMEQT